MLSSLLLGAHHSICFEDLSEDAILEKELKYLILILLFLKNIKEKVESLSNRYKRIQKLYIDLSAK